MFVETPHIKANKEDFGKTILMPGDPLRAKYIAENFLENPVLVNNIRGVQGYTGTYDGIKVSVMASGMGMPSMGIYSYELFNFFDVKNIIRIGSAGAYQPEVKVRDIVIGQAACCESNFADSFHLPGTYAPIGSYKLIKCAAENAEKLGLRYHVGNIVSSDVYYNDDACLPESMRTISRWTDMGVLAVEMEAAALYMNAAKARKNALAICTVSNSFVTGEETTAEERQTGFSNMMRLALSVAVDLER